MDGYIRIITDEQGKFEDWEDYWGKSIGIEEEITNCIDYHLQDFTFKPNSLILIIFNFQTTKSYDYWSGAYEYDVDITIENEIVLIKNYIQKDIEEDGFYAK